MIKNTKKKVSIIVPVYNVENYIKRCLNSLVSQTLQDIEIIVINDGSTDNSQSIIDRFVKKYPDKIKAYKIENLGAAGARNVALEKATGEYIGFVDSDDYVERDMFEKLYHKSVVDNADIVSCAYYRETENKCVEKGSAINLSFGKSVFEAPNLLIDSVPYIWNKIFRLDIIKENNIKFEDLSIYEDLVFTYKLFINANRVSYVFEPLYFYTVTNEASLTYNFTEKRFDIFKAFQSLVDYTKEKGCFKEFRQELLFILLKHIYVVLEKDCSKATSKLKRKYIDEVFEFLDKNFGDWKDNIYYDKYKKDKKKYTSKRYWIFRASINKKTRNKAQRISTIIKKIHKLLFQNKFIGRKFTRYMKKPIDEKSILLNSQQGDNINGNMFYLLKELQNEEYIEYKIYVACKEEKEDEFIEKLDNYSFRYELIKTNTKKYAKVLATAKYLFNDTSFPAYFIKRKEQIYLNTWHRNSVKNARKINCK